MLRLEHISKIYPTGEVLKDVNWEVKAGDRIRELKMNLYDDFVDFFDG